MPVRGIGDKPLQVHGRGTIKIQTHVNGFWNHGTINDALYVPNLGANLFSIGAATELGVTAVFSKTQVKLTRGEKLIATGTRAGKNLYHLDIRPIRPVQLKSQVNLASAAAQTMHVWHQRLAHVNVKCIEQMASNQLVDGLKLVNTKEGSSLCEGFMYGKQHRQSFPTDGRTRATRIGELIHSDVCGPMSVPSPGGARFYVLFKDDYSGFRKVNFIKNKSDVFDCFTQFVSQLNNETVHRVKTLRSDNGGEYDGKEFESWTKKKDIRHESSAPYNPEQNGVSERDNRTIVESARSLLHMKKLPLELWAEAVNCAVHTLNRVITRTIFFFF